jgi:hypothetical protein
VSNQQKRPDYDPIDATARAEEVEPFIDQVVTDHQAMADLGAGTSVALAA